MRVRESKQKLRVPDRKQQQTNGMEKYEHFEDIINIKVFVPRKCNL